MTHAGQIAVVSLVSGLAAFAGYRVGGPPLAGIFAGLFGFAAAAAVTSDFPSDPDPFG